MSTYLRGDALSVADRLDAATDAERSRFDLIFLDPPYQQDWLARTLPVCARLLNEGGLVYAEAEQTLASDAPPDWLAGWEWCGRTRRAWFFITCCDAISAVKFKA